MESFNQALPIWIANKELEMNITAQFTCKFDRDESNAYFLKLTGSCLYSVYLNGHFIHYGPVRASHGIFRIDTLPLDQYLQDDENVLDIYVAGYNCYSYYTLNQPSFLQCELLENADVIRYTGINSDFHICWAKSRIQNVPRYSVSRPFTEVYDLSTHHEPLNVQLVDFPIRYKKRELPIPQFSTRHAEWIVDQGSGGTVDHDKTLAAFDDHSVWIKSGQQNLCFASDQMAEHPLMDLFQTNFESTNNDPAAFTPTSLNAGQYITVDLNQNLSGFITSQILVAEDADVCLVFDEKLVDMKFDIESWSAQNVIKYHLPTRNMPYSLQSFEAYGFRYLMCYVRKGRININQLGLVEYSTPKYENIQFHCSNEQINTVYQAALDTFRQNAVDLLTDCPTRERAGWLCDSYYTAQSAYYFTGSPQLEQIFLENFIHVHEFPFLPEGMLPMCYPADHPDGRFIPQRAMWYVIQLDEYFKRNPTASKSDYENLSYNLVKYFKDYENEDGLLECLDNWNFIEWSQANEWTNDVNYPTNMLYSKMLHCIGTWYNDINLIVKSSLLKSTIIEQSYNGEFFIDNAVRNQDNQLILTNNRSETCQYYAYYFDIADIDDPKFRNLTNIILYIFGTDRKKRHIMSEIVYSNSLVGNYIRMELLLRWGRYQQAQQEIIEYYYPMAESTGTLWEHVEMKKSLNHGFASYIGVAILHCILGLKDVNMTDGTVELDSQAITMLVDATIHTKVNTIHIYNTENPSSIHMDIQKRKR